MDKITVSCTLDDGPFRRQLSNIEARQLPFAAKNALNDVAGDVLELVRDRMKVVFDRPTRWTQNAFRIDYARKTRLEAVVKLKDQVAGKHYLKVQEEGGPRPQTAFEKGMALRLPYEGVIRAVIPTQHARLDAFGNWSSGERNQVMSALGVQRNAGDNTSEASRKRNKGRASYFVPKKGLAPGVYKRTQPGGIPVKVLNFSDSAPTYSARLGFEKSAVLVWQSKLPTHLARRLDEAIATAK